VNVIFAANLFSFTNLRQHTDTDTDTADEASLTHA